MPGVRPVGRFPPASRVRKRSEYRLVQSAGQRVHTEHCVLLLYARDEDPEGDPRLGVVASRKIGHAVQRNRAKRLIREAFRASRPLWSAGMDIVVIVRREMSGATLESVVHEWRDAAERIARRADAARRERVQRRERMESE